MKSKFVLQKRRDEGRNKRKYQDFFLDFEMGHFLDSCPPDFWCPSFLKIAESLP